MASRSSRKMMAVRAIRPKAKRRPRGKAGVAIQSVTGKGRKRYF